MTDQEILELHMIQSENVRFLNQVIKLLIKDINLHIRKSDDFQVNAKTKIFSLVYSAWSEAQFVQILFTPHGFLYPEILKIKDKGVVAGWKLMIEQAINRVGDPAVDNNLKNKLDKLNGIIKQYIEAPYAFRNKIAHGQWVRALNKDKASENQKLTNDLGQLDPLEIYKRVKIHGFLGDIVRDLIQSPKKAFNKNYLKHISNLEEFIEDTKNWTLIGKKERLLKKPIQR